MAINLIINLKKQKIFKMEFGAQINLLLLSFIYIEVYKNILK